MFRNRSETVSDLELLSRRATDLFRLGPRESSQTRKGGNSFSLLFVNELFVLLFKDRSGWGVGRALKGVYSR